MNLDNVQVDREKMCIDRNSELGKCFADAAAMLEKEPNEQKKEFFGQLLAYSEAALVIDAVEPAGSREQKIAKLAQRMIEK